MRKIMMTVLACAGCAAAAAPATAQVPAERTRTVFRAVAAGPHVVMYQRGAEEQTDRQTRTIRIGGQGHIDVSNLSGDISIARGGGNEATIEIVKRARGRSAEEAREMLGLVQVQVIERGGRVEVRAEYPRHSDPSRGNRRGVNVSVAYTITAPAGTQFSAKSLSGNLKATDIKGDLNLETLSGNVTISGAGRIASAKSMSGDVSISDTQVEGGIGANSMSGNVTMRNGRARRLDIGSVSGNIIVQDVECESADLHSFSGNVEYSGAFAKNGRYVMKSHSGNVRLALAGRTGFEIEATTFSGALRSDLPIEGQDPQPASDRARRRSLRGVFGDGSAIVEITTFSGSVVISRR